MWNRFIWLRMWSIDGFYENDNYYLGSIKMGKFLTNVATISFPSNTPHYGVNISVLLIFVITGLKNTFYWIACRNALTTIIQLGIYWQ